MWTNVSFCKSRDLLEKPAMVLVMEALIAERWEGAGVSLDWGIGGRGASRDFVTVAKESSSAGGGGGLWKPEAGDAVGRRLREGPVGRWSSLKFLFVRRGLLGVETERDIGLLTRRRPWPAPDHPITESLPNSHTQHTPLFG
jgi:hypothetical protein